MPWTCYPDNRSYNPTFKYRFSLPILYCLRTPVFSSSFKYSAAVFLLAIPASTRNCPLVYGWLTRVLLVPRNTHAQEGFLSQIPLFPHLVPKTRHVSRAWFSQSRSLHLPLPVPRPRINNEHELFFPSSKLIYLFKVTDYILQRCIAYSKIFQIRRLIRYLLQKHPHVICYGLR